MKKQLLQFIFIFGIHSSYASEKITLTKSTELNIPINSFIPINSLSNSSSFDSDEYYSFNPRNAKTYFQSKKKHSNSRSQDTTTLTITEVINKLNNFFNSFVLPIDNQIDISEFLNENNENKDCKYFTINEFDRSKLIKTFITDTCNEINEEVIIIENIINDLTSYKMIEVKPNSSSWKVKDEVLSELQVIINSFENNACPIINLKNTEREWKGYSEYCNATTIEFSLIFNNFFSEILQKYICINSGKFYYIWRILNDINKEFDESIFSINEGILTIPDKDGKTALMYLAFSRYNKENLKYFLKKLKEHFSNKKILDINLEEFINKKDIHGNTALIYAVMKNNLTFFNLLLKYGADINISDNKSNTIAHIIAKKKTSIKNENTNQASMLITCIKAGADLSIKNEKGKTAFYCAVERQNLEVIKNFITNSLHLIDINTQDTERKTPLHNLIRKDFPDQEILKLLLENEANPTIPNNKNKNALMYFFKLNNINLYKKINGILKKLDSEILIENLNLLDSKGRNTLMNILKRINCATAPKSKNKKNKKDYLSKILEKIITKTNDLNIIDSYPENTVSKRNQKKLGNTALIYAVMNNNATAVKLLLEHGAAANIDHQNNDGKSALAYASEKGYHTISGLLLDSGANLM